MLQKVVKWRLPSLGFNYDYFLRLGKKIILSFSVGWKKFLSALQFFACPTKCIIDLLHYLVSYLQNYNIHYYLLVKVMQYYFIYITYLYLDLEERALFWHISIKVSKFVQLLFSYILTSAVSEKLKKIYQTKWWIFQLSPLLKTTNTTASSIALFKVWTLANASMMPESKLI